MGDGQEPYGRIDRSLIRAAYVLPPWEATCGGFAEARRILEWCASWSSGRVATSEDDSSRCCIERGHALTLAGREPARLAERFPGVRTVHADLLDAPSMAAAVQGIDVAYYLAHSMAAGEAGFAERDLRAARDFATAAAAAGVGRIIYLGGLGDDATGLSHHLASRHAVGAELAAHGVPVTEFRAAVVIGSGSASFEMLRQLTERLPVMITPRWVKTRCQPIGIQDVLDYLCGGARPARHPGHRGDRRPGRAVVRRHDAHLCPASRPAATG